MKFVMSYSCGKDSSLALSKMLEDGHEPVALLVMFNKNEDRSYFHGVKTDLLERIVYAINIPVILCPSKGEDYHSAFEKGLKKAMAMGAEFACFGDIDIGANKEWGVTRCRNVGLKWEYPLWQRKRADIVEEIIAKGFKCIIKSLDNRVLPKELLGEFLNEETVDIMKKSGIDICGENGEYHTLTVGGPIFKSPVTYEIGETLDIGEYSVIDIK